MRNGFTSSTPYFMKMCSKDKLMKEKMTDLSINSLHDSEFVNKEYDFTILMLRTTVQTLHH